MTLESRLFPSTIHPTSPRTPWALAMTRATAIVMSGGLLLATAAGAQSSEPRAEPRAEPRTEARTDSAIDPQQAGGPIDHRRPGWHGHGYGHGPRHPMMGRLLGRLDIDRDGAVSRAELEADHQRQIALFDQADTDHDGKVTADELRAVHARVWKESRGESRRQGRSGSVMQGDSPARSPQGGEPAR